MGMVWVARLASDTQVAQILQKPDDAYDFINSEGAYEDGSAIDLDKQWHAIHFLLTGSADVTSHPLSLIIGKFREIGPDNGYGSAWLIPKEFLLAFDHALSALNEHDLAARYDPAAMVRDEVYIAESLEEEGPEGLEFLQEDIKRLRVFASKAAANSMNAFGVIT